MSYAEIGELMDCKELRARVLFFRAKRSLRQQLSRRGYRKGLLLPALVLFGVVTTPAKGVSAAGTVTAASLDVGATAALAGWLGTKVGMAVSTLITALGVGLATNEFVFVACLVFYVGICFVAFLCMD